MKRLIESARFPRELGGWALRGGLCAASSFWWALMADFNSPREIAGMVAGVLGWVALFALFCVWFRASDAQGRDRLVPALKVAAWIKFLLTVVGWGVFALCSQLKSAATIVDAGILFVMPDCLLGITSVKFVSLLSGQLHPEKLDSFGLTTLITLVDGALFAFVVFILALAVLVWWRIAPRLLAWLRISPVRTAG